MDMSTSHLHPKVLKFLYENDITYVTIPPWIYSLSATIRYICK